MKEKKNPRKCEVPRNQCQVNGYILTTVLSSRFCSELHRIKNDFWMLKNIPMDNKCNL